MSTEKKPKPTPGTGSLIRGIKIGETVHKDFVMREALTEDMFEAEKIAPPEQGIAFNAAMMTRQLQSIGTFQGPFTHELIGKLPKADFMRLREAQQELDKAGEAEQLGIKNT